MILVYDRRDNLYKSVKRYLNYVKKEKPKEIFVEKFYNLTKNKFVSFKNDDIYFVLNFRNESESSGKEKQDMGVIDDYQKMSESPGFSPFVSYSYASILNNLILNDTINYDNLYFFGIYNKIESGPNNYYESFCKRINTKNNENIILYKITGLIGSDKLMKSDFSDPNFVYTH